MPSPLVRCSLRSERRWSAGLFLSLVDLVGEVPVGRRWQRSVGIQVAVPLINDVYHLLLVTLQTLVEVHDLLDDFLSAGA